MGGRAAKVVGDSDGEGIRAVEVGGRCVRPGAGFGIDGGGAIARHVAAFDGEIGVVGEPICIGCIEITGDDVIF